MPRSNQTGEFNTFVGGLVTEASPLTFPENGSLDEANFVLNRDGSRQRRLGMDYAVGLTPYPITYTQVPLGSPTISTFSWENVAGIAKKTFLVCQVHDKIYIVDRGDITLDGSGSVKKEITIAEGSQVVSKASFAAVSGFLIVAYGDETVKIVEYVESTDSFLTENVSLKTRDFFGVEDTLLKSGEVIDLLSPEYVNFRPDPTGNTPFTSRRSGEDYYEYVSTDTYEKKYAASWVGSSTGTDVYINGSIIPYSTAWAPYNGDTIGIKEEYVNDGDEVLFVDNNNLSNSLDNHVYNLRNQSWGIPRLEWTGSDKTDTITQFEFEGAVNKGLPSNADISNRHLYANTTQSDKNTERFDRDSARSSEPVRARAPVGHFVIDVLNRGTSREEAIARMSEVYTKANDGDAVAFRNPTVDLPEDKTNGGASVVAEFAGRVFYAGFTNDVTNGDSQSPQLASYIFYSQIVTNKFHVNLCYQEGDPTDIEAPDLLETDGGFIKLAGATNIQALIDVGDGLMAVAENGVWFVRGSDTGTFSATNQSVIKISEHGTTAPSSVVLVDGTIAYWSDDAIYHITKDNSGSWVVQDLSQNIKTLYQEIDSVEKVYCQGAFDSYDKKVRWLYNCRTESTNPPQELIFDLQLGAFYPATIGQLGSGNDPLPLGPVNVPPFNSGEVSQEVLVGVDMVLSDTEDVVVTNQLPSSGFRETEYLTLLADNSITFSAYNNGTFKDWVSEDSVGVDAPAYLLTGYIGNGDLHRHKQIPYIFFHLLRTETGFIDDGDDLIPQNESSCLVQSQWDWTDSPAYGKWGRQFQAYRYRRHYTPEDVNDEYDYGTKTIVTKNKLRGRGRVVSLLISSEPEKDLNLLGWSMGIGMNGNI
jgi:hypothetical protein